MGLGREREREGERRGGGYAEDTCHNLPPPHRTTYLHDVESLGESSAGSPARLVPAQECEVGFGGGGVRGMRGAVLKNTTVRSALGAALT